MAPELGVDAWGGRPVACADRAGRPSPAASWTADEAVTRLFASQYRPLVRLAALLLRDAGAAEEIAQDAFVGAARAVGPAARPGPGGGLPAPERGEPGPLGAAPPRRGGPVPRPAVRAADACRAPRPARIAAQTHAEVLAAVATLPARQREALVLRYYLDLSEAQTAEAMGVSAGRREEPHRAGPGRPAPHAGAAVMTPGTSACARRSRPRADRVEVAPDALGTIRARIDRRGPVGGAGTAWPRRRSRPGSPPRSPRS